MPLIRKIIPSGGSRTISLPKSWIENHENESGHKIDRVAIEVNDILTIKPYIPKGGKRP